MATPKEFSVGQGLNQVFSVYDQNSALEQAPDEAVVLNARRELNGLIGRDKSSWNSLKERSISITGKFKKVDSLCKQFDAAGDAVNLSAALLTNMSLEVRFVRVLDEMEQFLTKKNLPAVKGFLREKIQVSRLAINMPVGPLSISEFLKNGGEKEMVKKSLGMLVDAQVNGNFPQDLSYEGLMVFDAQKIVRAGILATQSEEFLKGTNSRIPNSAEITETMQGFVDNITKTQENIRAVLLSHEDEDVREEFARLFDLGDDAGAFVCCTLGFRDGRDTMLFIKRVQKLATAGSSKDLAFYTTLSEYLREQVKKNDPSAIVTLENIYDSSADTEAELFGPRIEEIDFEDSINALLDSPVSIKQVISPQETYGLLNPDDIAIELSDEYATADLVWDTNQGGNRIKIRLDRKEHTIDWSIINNIDSPEVRQKREILLSYVLETFNLTADSVRPKNRETQQQEVEPQKAETHWVRNDNKGYSEKETIRPKVRLDCPIQIDSIKVEALILASNIRKIHRQKVLAALEDWNAGKGRMLSRVDDKTFKLHVGKVAVSLQEEDGILSIMEISYAK